MNIQKIIYVQGAFSAKEILALLQNELSSEIKLFQQWQSIKPMLSAERAATRDQKAQQAYRVEATFADEIFENLIENFPQKDAQTIFIGTALEEGWDIVPHEDEIAYLHGEFENGELKSVCKYWGKIRHYALRGQLLPNLIRFKRVVVLSPNIMPFIEEAYSIFPQRCYIISEIVARIAGKMDDLETLARLNEVPLQNWDDYIVLMEKIAGKEAVLSHGKFKLEPITWPILN